MTNDKNDKKCLPLLTDDNFKEYVRLFSSRCDKDGALIRRCFRNDFPRTTIK